MESQPRENWHISSGVEYYHDFVRSKTQVFEQAGSVPEERRGLYPDQAQAFNLAIFSLHTLSWDKFQVLAGLRGNLFHLEANDATFGGFNLNPTALVGNVGFMYYFHPNYALTASVNSAFRAPNINDLSSFGLFDAGIEVPSGDLSSEKSVGYEAGFKTKSARFSATVVAFYTQLYDLISRVRATYQGNPSYEGDEVYRKENIAQAYIQGVEAELGYQIIRGAGGLRQCGLRLRSKRNRQPAGATYSSAQRSAGGWLYQNTKRRIFGRVEGLFATKQDRLSSGDKSDHRIPEGGTPGWHIMNIYMGYNHPYFDIQLGIQNLWDEAYRIHGSGVDGYGRSFWLVGRIHL
ncbi:MAG: TonB-dependent receptor [Bacteroidia bacterium]|nr:TonB-dependent receptor [Bacteroidia bacterium]